MQVSEGFCVTKAHESTFRPRVVETNGVANFMNQSIADVVNVFIAIETDFPLFFGIQANECPIDEPHVVFGAGQIGYIGEDRSDGLARSSEHDSAII